MRLKNEFDSIRSWAKERGILDHGNSKTQFVKLLEEVGELAKGILEEKPEEIEDAIGDIVVVLTSIASIKGHKIEDCINTAYEVISKRRGKMIKGNFVKFKKDEVSN